MRRKSAKFRDGFDPRCSLSNDVRRWMRVADCKPARLDSISRHVSTLLLRDCSVRISNPRRPGSTPGGSATSRSSRRLRKLGSHPNNAGSNPARDTVSLLTDERRRYERCLGGSIPSRDATALAHGLRTRPPKSGSAVRLSTGAPRTSETALHAGLIPRRHWGSTPQVRNGDNARRDAVLIRPAAVVRLHLSPLRDRLLARITKL